VASHDYPSCLQQLQTVVRSIPQDKKPPTHHFYPYHQEIGSILHLVASASANVFTARYSLSNWLTSEVQTRTLPSHLPSLLSSSSLQLALASYNQTKTSLLEAITLQNSFHYMEPEGFYLSITECYIPFLQEVRSFLLFLKGLLWLSSPLLPREDLSSRFIETFILELSQTTGVDAIERWSGEEKRSRFPLRDSIWHRRSLEKIQQMIEREKETVEWDRGREGEVAVTDRLEAMTQWYAKERRESWDSFPRTPSSSSSKPQWRGSCCELLYC
jgi:hypothetical protein